MSRNQNKISVQELIAAQGDRCRYCGQPVEVASAAITYSYWQGLPFVCHAGCKDAGAKQEALDCQVIDADCNDCKHFQRGHLVKRELSDMIDGKPGKRLVSMDIWTGHCRRFDQPAFAYPMMCTGRPCFEHRRL